MNGAIIKAYRKPEKNRLGRKEQNMMKRSMLTSVFLSLLALTLLLSACGDKEINPPPDASQPPDVTTAGGDPGTGDVPDIPIMDFDGSEVVFLTRNSECGDFETWDLLETDLQGDSMNAAIVRRNSYIQDTYDVSIVQRQYGGSVNEGEMYTAIYNNFFNGGAAAEDAFHVAYCGVTDAIRLAASGIFYDLSELPYIDLASSWWDAEAMSSLTIANRYYFGVGDISVQLYDTLPCLVFNKMMAQDYTTPDELYRMVEEGNWTYEEFYSIIREVYSDADDVAGPSVGDRFGAGGQNDNLYCFFYGSGCRTVTTNQNGDPELTIYSEQNNTVFTDLFELLTDREAFFNCNDYANVPGWESSPIEFVIDGFIGGRVLFYSDGLLHLPELREASFEFGILPVPKYTAGQESYYHLIGMWGATLVTVPAGCPDVKMTALLLEAMGAQSEKTVATEYFEQKLALQSVRDSESAGSLGIIIDTKGFDMGQCFRWNDLHLILGDCLTQKNNSFYSNYQGKVSGIQIEMNKTISAYQSLPHYIELED